MFIFEDMNTVTIPKNITQKGELIVIPKREYDEFSRWKKAVRVRFEDQWFWTPEWQKKEAEADAAIRVGKIKGPFSSRKKLIASLKQRGK